MSTRVRQYRKNIRRFYAVVGKAVLAGYVQWKEYKRFWERGYFDRLGASGGSGIGERVQGGEPTPPQERALEIMTHDREYLTLCRRIEKAQQIIDSLPEEKKAILESYCWSGNPWHECAGSLGKGRSAFFQTIADMEVQVGRAWDGDGNGVDAWDEKDEGGG